MDNIVNELRSTLAKMEAALGAINEAIFWTDSTGRLLWCNTAFGYLTGMLRISMLNKPVDVVFPLSSTGGNLPRSAHPVIATLETKEQHYGIYTYTKDDGERLYEVQCFPFDQGNGEHSSVGIVSDLTDIQEAELVRTQGVALAEAENAICITTPSGNITWANKSWEVTAGTPLSLCHGKPFLERCEIVGDINKAAVLAVLEAGKSWEGTILSHAPSQAQRVERVTATPVKDADQFITNIVVVKHDITEQVKSEEALAKSEGKLRAILDQAVDAIITADHTGRIESVNMAALEMFGYEAEELADNNVSILTPPNIRDHHHEYMERYLQTGEAKIIGIGREAEALRKDGTIFPIELSISEIQLGNARYFTAIIRDISERKMKEEQILSLNSSLKRKQDNINEALDSAAEIQRSLLPVSLPDKLPLEVEWHFVPSEQVGGDILGVVPMDPKGHQLAFYIVDVAGHGVPAAMVAAAVVQALHRDSGIVFANGPVSPGKVLRELDRQFPLDRFGRHFTIFYGVIDSRSGEFVYSSGGHPLAYIVSADGTMKKLDRGGTIIGLGGLMPFEEGSGVLNPGEKIVLYTDGIIELENKLGNQFGEERLRAVLERFAGDSAKMLLDELYDAVNAFTDASPQDDISMLAIGK